MATKSSLSILVDTREQRPYKFRDITPRPKLTVATLKTGDYTLEGFEKQIAVERKSLIDAFSTFGAGRKRFERSLERMMDFDFSVIIIEADWHTIIRTPPQRSKLNPKSFYASVIAWEQRYGVHFWCCPNRAFAERTCYRILERFYIDRSEGRWTGIKSKKRSSGG
jgi:ERCC4-type nuclease